MRWLKRSIATTTEASALPAVPNAMKPKAAKAQITRMRTGLRKKLGKKHRKKRCMTLLSPVHVATDTTAASSLA
jgi:hypothetical protein